MEWKEGSLREFIMNFEKINNDGLTFTLRLTFPVYDQAMTGNDIYVQNRY